jgi:hypothetical protein
MQKEKKDGLAMDNKKLVIRIDGGLGRVIAMS